VVTMTAVARLEAVFTAAQNLIAVAAQYQFLN
jgi:hypothetical protein